MGLLMLRVMKTLPVVGSVAPCLATATIITPVVANRMGWDFESKLEFHPRRKRCSIVFARHVVVRDYPQHSCFSSAFSCSVATWTGS